MRVRPKDIIDLISLMVLALSLIPVASAQSARSKQYSESAARGDRNEVKEIAMQPSDVPRHDDDVVRVETDLVTIPVRANTRKGRPVPDIRREEFKLFENGVEQEIAYFSTADEPFTVALMLDMSYSSVFKLKEIQEAALTFIGQLRNDDRVMVVSFDEKIHILCEPTKNRRVLRYAIEGAQIASGTSLYSAMSEVINERLRNIPGRKAIVLLSDGVDTTSVNATAKSVMRDVDEMDILIYPIQYNTFDDVRRSRRNDAQILYDDDDRPYVAETPPAKGEREQDYAGAAEFLRDTAERTGGRVQKVRSTTNLSAAFATIASELRKTYSLGYYPSVERKSGTRYFVRVRIYRPNLEIRARENYSGGRTIDQKP
jgi:VWFA-related protein